MADNKSQNYAAKLILPSLAVLSFKVLLIGTVHPLPHLSII